MALLIEKLLEGELTEAETLELNNWRAESPANEEYIATELMGGALEQGLNIRKNMNEESTKTKVDRLLAQTQRPVRRLSGRILRVLMAAACLIGLILVTTYFLKPDKKAATGPTQSLAITRPDIAPGGNKAVLTLADGSRILLDSSANGVLSTQGSARVIKLDNGQLAYRIDAANTTNATATEIVYNTLATPIAGQYQIALPDGTKVWLNNASSIRYPTSFSGAQRAVELTGEAYFDVTKDKGRPFIVHVATPGKDMQIEVLGTGFNVMAYADEAGVKATLVEGAIDVKAAKTHVVLKPGQQAQSDAAAALKVAAVDTRLVTAWKDGFFNFSKADIKTVMRQLSRWYAIDVQIEGNVPEERTFSGRIGRNLNLSQVLDILENNQVHFKIEGKKVIVTP